MRDPYVIALGKIVGNLHALEFSLRAFLFNRNPNPPFPPGQAMATLQVGDLVPENAFTNYDTLGMLISKYNSVVSEQRRIDQSIADLRDALAHGRVSSPDTDSLHLLKFAKPIGGRTTVTWSQTLSDEWLMAQRRRVYEAAMKVSAGAGPPA